MNKLSLEFQSASTLTFEPSCPSDGTWLDEDVRLIGEKGSLLLSLILMMVSDDLPHRRDFRRNFERRLECVIANALRAHFYRASSRVAYRRGTADYAGRPRWLSAPSLRAIVDRLVELGLLSSVSGQWCAFGSAKGFASTYWIAQPFEDLIQFCGVTWREVGKPEPPLSSLIKLRAKEDDKKHLLPFNETEETLGWAYGLDEYNRFAGQHDIGIGALTPELEGQLLAGWNNRLAEHSRQPPLVRPEFFNRHLHRIFNDGTFEHGGRMFGAWYQFVPSWLRSRIRIDDNQTVELDYSGMSLRMLHHLVGSDYRDDPYSIAALEAYAIKTHRHPAYFRNSVKKLVQAMLNNEDDECQPEMIQLEIGFRPRFTRKQVRDMILRRHAAVSELFDIGIGKALQRIEADIALDVITRLMDEGILSLPIHDSFIVQKKHRERLRQQMISSYRSQIGFDPIIKVH